MIIIQKVTAFFVKVWRNNEKIKNFIVSIAIIAGGIWTVFTFQSLKQIERAKFELELLRTEFLGKPSLNIFIDVNRTNPTNKSYYAGLIINVNVENKGTRYISMSTLDTTLVVSEIKNSSSWGTISVNDIYLDPITMYCKEDSSLTPSGIIEVTPNSTEEVPYYCEVERPGIYFISFNAKIAKESMDELDKLSYVSDTSALMKEFKKLGLKYENISTWSCQKYIEIK
ncbi:MAG TPA: hypothetical protein VJY62_00795 [Bacteroidia bacterium]|nr:hypothetical protein [Bacteroidia bacterium]